MRKILVLLILLILVSSACQTAAPPGSVEPTPSATPAALMPNPASQNCFNQGGTLSIKARGDGGQYGVCTFEDGLQCEEWAMMRGDCPMGGIKVTGYVTDAARYCAITGGTYTVTGNSNTDTEQGTCTLKDGSQCDAWDYYNGKCSPGTSPTAEATQWVSSTLSAANASQMIVFDSNRGQSGYRDLYTMNGLGGNVSRVTGGDSNSFAGPWSPDGKRFVYTAFGLTNSQIDLINADGSGRATIDALDGSDEAFPDWSPDGARIAFTSRRDGNNEIYLMNADGSNPVRLTDSPGDDFSPSWSPDGAKIVFVSDRDHSPGVYDLYIMNADGSGISRLTNDSAIDYSPDWSPDGKRVVFRSHNGGPADIYVINIDGTGLTNLTNNPAEDWAPSWSPDGSQIAFQTDRDGNWEIYRMSATGTDAVNLTNNPSDDQSPFYRP